MIRLLLATCLKPHYSLRYQLFVSYGITSAIAIGVVMLIATLTAKSTGDFLTSEARDLLKGQVIANTRDSSENAADTLSKRVEHLEGIVSLMAEFVADRIVGYPNNDWEADRHVPFFDSLSGKNVYPLLSDPLPPDWNITINVNETNHQEHVQNRWSWYSNVVSTKSAVYRIQGQCNPSETDPTSQTYYKDCTEANNNLLTGGVLQPTDTNQYLAEKAADLAIFLKPLYETHTDVKTVGIYFANSGAGSSLVYPGQVIDGRSSYESIGCDWMRAINNSTGLPYGTNDDIKRCHPQGTWVPGREYNPLERQWCRDQALNPDETQIAGPYVNAFNLDLWLLTIGKALFDRMTGHFVGCTLLDVSIAQIADILSSVQTDESSDIAMVRWEDSTVVYSREWNTTVALETIHCWDLHICDNETFDHVQSLVDFDAPWDHEGVMAKFRESTYAKDGNLIAAFPIPQPPLVYDATYRPKFMVIQSVGNEVFSLLDKIEASIDEDVSHLYIVTISIGLLGIFVVLVESWSVAIFLTRPLNWMMDVAKRILDHSSDNAGDSIYGHNKKRLVKCTPKTEITDLVSEFESIIEGFSGDGPALVASPTVHEVLNTVSWEKEFGNEYFEQLLAKPKKAEGESERRPSFALSVPSYASKSTELDEISLDGIDNEIGTIAADEITVPQSQMKRRQKQPALASAIRSTRDSSPKAGAIDDVTLLDEEAATVPLAEAKIVEKPTEHLMSCSFFTRINKGPVTYAAVGDGHFENELRTSLNRSQILRSPLFWWIVILMVAPVLMTMALICLIVTADVTTVLPSWLEEAEKASSNLEGEAIISTATSRAALEKENLVDLITDLHLQTRIAGWLLFGGLKPATTFTDMSQATEECKTFPPNMSCGFFSDNNRAPCECSWNDPWATECQTFVDARSLQKQFYAGQAQDSDPVTGARTATSFPSVDDSPSATLWWNETMSMPGSSNHTFVQGYATVYERTSVMSAMATVNVPLYNYRGGHRRKHLGMFIGFEADGMLAGYSGCDYSYAHFSHFQSTTANGASMISPNLCPLGKYGYDPRCRGWYKDGKLADTFHWTAPYVDAVKGEVVTSVTFPLVDPSSGEHVGQTMIDFLPEGLLDATEVRDRFDRRPNTFTIFVTPSSGALGGDTLAGPGYAMGSTSPPIQHLVMPCDDPSSQNRRYFDADVLAAMKQGQSGERSFHRRAFVRNDDEVTCTVTEESMFISYAPIVIRSSKPVRSDDFARGVNVSEILMGSLGIVVPTEDLRAPFALIENQASDTTNGSTRLLFGLMAATAAITTVIVAIITLSIVKPVTTLLELVRLINKKHTLHYIPPMRGGSSEVNQVYASLAKLHLIVRFSNMAFFSGKLNRAYKFLTDALSLFRSAGDQKAIGIAANNLGNTCMAIRNQKLSTNRCFRIDGKCVQSQAFVSYSEAIESATNEYDKVSNTRNDDLRAKLREQLANRYFNRGLFFLLTTGDACAAEKSEEKGRQDLLKARALDAEVRDIWVETRHVHKNSVQYFERLLRRANGLISLLMLRNISEGGSWNVAELLDEADSLLFVAWNMPGSPLFDSMSPTGRRQQLEATAIRYELCRGKTREAARISHRILTDDEYIIEPAVSASASAMLSWFREEPPPQHLRASELAIQHQLRCMQRSCKTSSDAAKTVVFFHDLAIHHECDYIFQSFAEKLHGSCHDEDLMMMMSSSACTDALLRLQRNGDLEQPGWSPRLTPHRIVDINTDFRRAIRIVLESDEANENDTWIIVTTDRGRWNPVECRLSESHHYLLSEIEQLNRARDATIHVAIVSLDAEDNMAEICSELCRVSRKSKYIDVKGGPDVFDDALEDIASLVIGGSNTTYNIPDGTTVEALC